MNDAQVQYNTSIWDIVANIEHAVLDMLAHHQRLVESGDQQLAQYTDSQYRGILQDVVYQITALPADRIEHNLDPITDSTELAKGYSHLIDMLSAAFGRSRSEIESDMKQYTRKYTAEDILIARRLKRNNLLN